MLKECYREIQEYKELFGDEFQDFNFVFCNANGRPMESQIISRALQKLIKDNDLPPVVFHSLRHSSITYKLRLNGKITKWSCPFLFALMCRIFHIYVVQSVS